jgi:hypothetical protein
MAEYSDKAGRIGTRDPDEWALKSLAGAIRDPGDGVLNSFPGGAKGTGGLECGC